MYISILFIRVYSENFLLGSISFNVSISIFLFYEKVPPQNTSLSLLQLHFLLALNFDYPRFVGHLFNHRRFGLLAFIAGLPSSPSLFMSSQLADKLLSFYSLDFSFCRSLFPTTEYEVWQSIASSSSCSHSTVDSPLCFWESSSCYSFGRIYLRVRFNFLVI